MPKNCYYCAPAQPLPSPPKQKSAAASASFCTFTAMIRLFYQCWLALLLGFAEHPFFVGVVEAQHNATEKTLEVSVRLFTDDFEETLRKQYPAKPIDLIKVLDKAYTDTCVSRYIRSRLQMMLPSQQLSLQYLGFEKIEESVWCYFEVSNLPSIKQLQVVNRLLYDTRAEQINMHHIVIGGKRQSRQMRNPEASFTFYF